MEARTKGTIITREQRDVAYALEDDEICYLWQKACQNKKEDDERGYHSCAHSSRVEKNLTPSYEEKS